MTLPPEGIAPSYQLQPRKCGKSSCQQCSEGAGHGPYWYVYWREQGRIRSGYIGKTLPEGAVITAYQQQKLLALQTQAAHAPQSTPHRSTRRVRKAQSRPGRGSKQLTTSEA